MLLNNAGGGIEARCDEFEAGEGKPAHRPRRQPLGAGKDLRFNRYSPGGNDPIIAIERFEMSGEVGAIVRRQIKGRHVVRDGILDKTQIKGADAGGRRLVGTFEREVYPQGKDAPFLGGGGHQREQQVAED